MRLYAVLLIIFVGLVSAISLARLANLDDAATFTGDYATTNVVLKAVGSGVSPFSRVVQYYYGSPAFPFMSTYEVLTVILFSLPVALGVPAPVVTYTLMPIALAMCLAAALWFYVNKTGLSDGGAAVLVLCLLFVNDWALPSLYSNIGAEALGISLSIMGLGFLTMKRRSLAALAFTGGVLSHVFNAVFIGVVAFSVGRRHFKTFIPAIIAALLLVSVYAFPVPRFYAEAPAGIDPEALYTPPELREITVIRLDSLMEADADYSESRYFNGGIMNLLIYPLAHIYYNSVGRSAVQPVMRLMGGDFTAGDAERLASLQFSAASVLPLLTLLVFGCGLTFLFLFAFYCTRGEERLLMMAAYLAPIVYAAIPVGVFPSRVLLYAALGLSVALSRTEVNKMPLFWVLSGMMVIRALVWAWVTVLNGGYGY